MTRHRTIHRWMLAAMPAAALTLAIAGAAQADPGWHRWRRDVPRHGYPARVAVFRDGMRQGAGPAIAGLIGGFVLGTAFAQSHPVIVRERVFVPEPDVDAPRAAYVPAMPRLRYEDAAYERSWDTLGDCREAALDPHGPRVVRVIDTRSGDCIRTLYWKHDHFIADDDREQARDD